MHNILIVVVLYKENLFSCATYKTLLLSPQGCGVYIYDNSPIPQHKCSDFSQNCIYISDPTNPGLSYAYNRAAEYASQNGYEWMLLADQDTIFTPDIIEKYITAINNNKDIKLFVPQFKTGQNKWLSPVRLLYNINLPHCKVKAGIYPLNRYSPINSGMMINIDAYMLVGGYNESVFLDYSDFQFIERFKEKFPCFVLLDTICRQNFSNEMQSKEQKYNRYCLFCRSLKNFQSESLLAKLGIHIVVFKRCISLCMRNFSFLPLLTFFNNYLKR